MNLLAHLQPRLQRALRHIVHPLILLHFSTVLSPLPAQSPADDSTSPRLTPEQLSAIVTISGDSSGGTGFICKLHDHYVVVTNQHVLAGSNEITFRTLSGELLRFEALYAANDRDLAVLTLAALPSGITPLTVLQESERLVATGDRTIIPGNSRAGGVVTQTPGSVVAIGPSRIETDNPVYGGNSGSPIIHLPTGKVIGVLTKARLLSFDRFDTASFKNEQSAIKSEIRYFGYRLDTVPFWEPLDWHHFQALDADIKQTERELESIASFLTNSSPIYKQFRELHEATNSAVEVLARHRLSNATVIDIHDQFIRQIEYLIRNAVNRVGQPRGCHFHQERIRELQEHGKWLQNAIEIAKRDSDLIRVLLQRRF